MADVTDALEAEGLRVARVSSDITPPVCYLKVGATTGAGAVLAGGKVVTVWVYYIPVRGVDNPTAEGAALDALHRALAPLGVADLTTSWTSLTLQSDTWPCHRADLTAEVT